MKRRLAQAYIHTDEIVDDWTSRVYNYVQMFADERLGYTTFFLVVLFIVLIAVIFLLIKNKRIGKKLLGQTAVLKRAEEEARAASKAKSAFLAHMSHEIRTPMNAIVGLTELILQDNLTKTVYENALCIKRAGVSMLSIINDILDFSKIEAGNLMINPVEYSFASLINDVLNVICMKVWKKPISFTVNIDCHIPAKLIGDEIRVRQIMFNLLSNAVKYTNEGHVAVDIAGKIEEHLVILSIEVSDSGIGIEQENLGKLFDDFYQIDDEKSGKVEGTGLGLAITKEICRAMDGDIDVKSEYGVGSTFAVTLPQRFDRYEALAKVVTPDMKRVLVYEPRSIYADSVARSLDNLSVRCAFVTTQSQLQEELNREPYMFVFVPSFLYDVARRMLNALEMDVRLVLMTEYHEVLPSANVITIEMPLHAVSIANVLNDETDNSGCCESGGTDITFTAPSASILIVDDVGTNLRVAEGLMARYQMQIDTCKSGMEAVDLAAKNRYDVIFMDHMMPKMDGIEAAARIRSLEDHDGYYRSAPIIAFTANAVSGMKEMFLQNGLNDFLAKPIEPPKLNGILDKWIPKDKREKPVCVGTALTPVMLEIEGIDVKAGLLMTGSVENYLKALSVFCADGSEKMNELKVCLEQNELKLYTTLVHALKSALKSIGAGKLSEFARMLEIAGKNEEITCITENTTEFFEGLEALLKNISTAIDNHRAGRETVGENDLCFLKMEAGKLRAALEGMDIRQINAIMNGLEARSWEKGTHNAIQSISKYILLFEFEEAVAVINGLIGVDYPF